MRTKPVELRTDLRKPRHTYTCLIQTGEAQKKKPRLCGAGVTYRTQFFLLFCSTFCARSATRILIARSVLSSLFLPTQSPGGHPHRELACPSFALRLFFCSSGPMKDNGYKQAACHPKKTTRYQRLAWLLSGMNRSGLPQDVVFVKNADTKCA
jgi:hypothetical protein